MYAPDEAAHPFQGFAIFQFRRAAAALGIDGKAIAVEGVQRLFARRERRHHGQLALCEFAHEVVLFQDLCVAPASGAVELRDDDSRLVLEPDLIHPVFVAVQPKQAPVPAQAHAVEGIEHAVGRESGVRRALFSVHAPIVRQVLRAPAGFSPSSE